MLDNSLKSTVGLQSPSVDIKQWPGDSKPSHSWFTLGDLHGNALKLLHFMVRVGAASISLDDYRSFVSLYYKKPIDKADINQFNDILNRITISDTAKIRLIGDDLCDRGSNDYWTLQFIRKIKKNKKAKIEIIRSNHGVEFSERFYSNNPDKFSDENAVRYNNVNEQTASILAMKDLIDQKIIDEDEINEIFQQDYQPSLKILSYDLIPGSDGNDELVIYSHAPINEIDILRAALCIPQADRTDALRTVISEIMVHDKPISNEFLITMINEINQIVSQKENEGKISQLLDSRIDGATYKIKHFGDTYSQEDPPLRHLLENRYDPQWMKMNTAFKSTCSFRCVHGHVGEGKNFPNCTNIDSRAGHPASKGAAPFPYMETQEYNKAKPLATSKQRTQDEINNEIKRLTEENLELLTEILSKTLKIDKSDPDLKQLAAIASDGKHQTLKDAILTANQARKRVVNNPTIFNIDLHETKMKALESEFNPVKNLIAGRDKIQAAIDKQINQAPSKTKTQPNNPNPPQMNSACGATLMHAKNPNTSAAPSQADLQRDQRRVYRHNIDALLSIYDNIKNNKHFEVKFIDFVKKAKIGATLDLTNGDYIIVNAQMQKESTLRGMIDAQIHAYEAVKNKPNSRLLPGYRQLKNDIDSVSAFRNEMHQRAQIKKWILTENLPDSMKQHLGGSTHVVVVTKNTQSKLPDHSKVYDNSTTPALADNQDLIQRLNNAPVSIELSGETWYIKGKEDIEFGVIFVKVKDPSEEVKQDTPFVTSQDVSIFAGNDERSLSAYVIEQTVLNKDKNIKVINDQTVRQFNKNKI